MLERGWLGDPGSDVDPHGRARSPGAGPAPHGGVGDTSGADVDAHLRPHVGQIGYLGLDVYEEEGDLFFEDLSDRVIQDDVFSRLLTFPNVLITGHQAFFTEEALAAIAATTVANIAAFGDGRPSGNEL